MSNLSFTTVEKPQPQVITCKAAVAWEPGQPLVIEEVDVSPPQPQEIRIKVVCTSLCRSDLSAWESQAIFPRIFGHEASGVVESVGKEVTEFEVGDHVLTAFTGECATCRHCTSGKSNVCQVLGLERRGVMHSDQKTRFSIRGMPVYHFCAVSSFSEYTVVHSGCAVKVSRTAPLEKICILSCGVAAGLGAVWNVADVSKSSTVVIFGLGTVGLSAAQGAKVRGASRIIGVDINSEKFQKAKAFGITEFINPNDYDEPIQKATDIIIHGLNIHHCQPQQGGKVASPEGLVNVNKADADAIRLISASNIWIDHNTLSECHDGLIDVTRGSTNITISNNWFTNQNKVMLLGHDDGYIRDKDMKVTIVYNHFGPNCNQRMPRIRHGYAHVANNLYNRWLSYAIGGSMDPRVKSESNFFIALETGKKEITWREGGDENSWNMYSVSDHFVNGASFKGTGHGGAKPHYTKTQRFKVKDAKFVQAVTKSAGALHCAKHFPC